MQFITLDTAYLPKDASGYQYILLVGDIFSKFVDAILLKDQAVPTIVEALLRHCIYSHDTPFYLLADQGSNVDGEIMNKICEKLGIERRRSSAYHNQGNGFAERNIRSIKDIFSFHFIFNSLDMVAPQIQGSGLQGTMLKTSI